MFNHLDSLCTLSNHNLESTLTVPIEVISLLLKNFKNFHHHLRQPRQLSKYTYVFTHVLITV